MAYLFRRKFKSSDGTIQECRNWTVRFADHNEIRREVTGFADKVASTELGRRLELLVAKKSSGAFLTGEDYRWIASLSNTLRLRLANWGILDEEHLAGNAPLSDQVNAYSRHLENLGRTEQYIKVQCSRVNRLLDELNIIRWCDVSAGNVQAILAAWRGSKMSTASVNHYLVALKGFGNWMVKSHRAQGNPVSHLSKFNAATDIRRKRRVLTVDECRRLIEAAAKGSRIYGMSGQERALLYRLALETGLRWSELRSLKKGSFSLDERQPSLIVEAGYSKHRREDIVPLKPDMAVRLQTYLANKDHDTRAFKMWPTVGSKIMQYDLNAAGIPYLDKSGRVADFHSLRHTFISNLANGGVHPSVAKKLARHSTIALTMDMYTHVALESQTAALNTLPSLDNIKNKHKRRAGREK